MQISKEILIDVSEDASNSTGVQTDGLLLSGIVFPSSFTGTSLTFDFSFDGTNWKDVVETDNTEVTYTVSADNVVRVDPSGWAFAAKGFIRVTSNGTETADRTLQLLFKSS